ncbi:OVARIAN TUMOR DOMAIN-containing deubiquitinating enzyme 6 isoform X1 [Benincasa hispida]|uniref:OVARIAN TUMOR DOMAIN-containing deubiquitinating enzyme 6 isoform X1 n=1 Tax=Benincasa hispida TaxID=102211 RepID=UPI0018FFD964|nr:OVARIAN TUMOR DOMAIN-containing deubiquitinating enzyme 6 isoform X1 [Benincasa hispida]
MTRVVIPRGSSGGSSTNTNRSSASASSSSRPEQHVSTSPQPASKDEELGEIIQEQSTADEVLDVANSCESKTVKTEHVLIEGSYNDRQMEILRDELSGDNEKVVKDDTMDQGEPRMVLDHLKIPDRNAIENECCKGDSSQAIRGNSPPPPPPAPPLKPSSVSSSNTRRHVLGSSNAGRIGSSRSGIPWSVVSNRTSLTGSRPSSPRSHVDSEGYNSADEQNSCYVSYYDLERERQFEAEIKRVKGFEVKRMLEDGNCLFRAVADQVYGDSEAYDLIRQMCIDYMERERDHFSQFITEGFTSYCKRKRRDKVYGNNAEIQALCEMYNRPIHIFSYGTEPINIFHGNYATDLPPIRLSYHHGNHYNSLVDPRRLAIGAGLGFSSLRGANVDKDKVKAALKAQQDQQLDNALLAQGRYFSDLEVTEKEIEQMVMEASRAEYLARYSLKHQLDRRDNSTPGAEPSSSGARSSGSEGNCKRESGVQESVLSNGMRTVLSMGFGYLQVIEAYSIFGDDVDSMVCYLLETGDSSRRKGKATE